MRPLNVQRGESEIKGRQGGDAQARARLTGVGREDLEGILSRNRPSHCAIQHLACSYFAT